MTTVKHAAPKPVLEREAPLHDSVLDRTDKAKPAMPAPTPRDGLHNLIFLIFYARKSLIYIAGNFTRIGFAEDPGMVFGQLVGFKSEVQNLSPSKVRSWKNATKNSIARRWWPAMGKVDREDGEMNKQELR